MTQLAEAKAKVLAKTGRIPQILRVLMNLIAEYKGSAANALFNYQALDEDDDDEDYDGSGGIGVFDTGMLLIFGTVHVCIAFCVVRYWSH